MTETYLLHDLLTRAARLHPDARALTYGECQVTYAELEGMTHGSAVGLLSLGLQRGERVAVYLEKRVETVVACFGASAAGAVFVPVNPILRALQVGHILQDCGVRVLVTSAQRLPVLADVLVACPELCHVVLTDVHDQSCIGDVATNLPSGVVLHAWATWMAASAELARASFAGHRVIDTDPVAILYTSGSTGKPKGVVVSHRNMLMGGKSVAQYLGNCADDVLLAVLPLSFDAGFSQLTTAFQVGARVVLLNHVLPQDVLKAVVRERVTGLTAVPPLWVQLVQLNWPASVATHLRYFANTGGRMPLETLTRLRQHFPNSRPFLMYGLTEAFRATYLPPEQVDARPDSIGQAIPNSEVLVLRPDGTPCDVDEPGELVQRGPLVALGYWNDAERTAERFRPLPAAAGVRHAALRVPEMVVFSGDVVRRDAEGYIYFIGRRDEMIKTSGYRVSPTEVEEVLYATQLVGECAAFGEADDALGQTIVAVVTPPMGCEHLDTDALLRECRARMPVYMVPRRIEVRTGSLPRNPNGKIDRKALSSPT
jgi:acyl-CoA ligase (AMP-forming) (exosortase A-associated)